MKVRCECDKGHVFMPAHYWVDTCGCPECDKIEARKKEERYGPISVDMVAEMLFGSGAGGEWVNWERWSKDNPVTAERWRVVSRAVIRLMRLVGKETISPDSEYAYSGSDYWHKRILELAREK